MRFVTDFRRVNKNIVRKPYPIPRISETMQQLVDGFQFATALDLNMGYYTIQLDAEESKDITTIVTEFGKCRYNVLPMGLVSSPVVCNSNRQVQERNFDMLCKKVNKHNTLFSSRGHYTKTNPSSQKPIRKSHFDMKQNIQANTNFVRGS